MSGQAGRAGALGSGVGEGGLEGLEGGWEGPGGQREPTGKQAVCPWVQAIHGRGQGQEDSKKLAVRVTGLLRKLSQIPHI